MTNFLYIFFGIITIILAFQFLVKIRGILRKGKPAPKVGGPLGHEILKGHRIVAYFYSPNCRACKTQEKYWPNVQKKFDNIVRINAAQEKNTAQAFGVMGTPTTVVIDSGIIKNYFVGITAPNKILKALNIN